MARAERLTGMKSTFVARLFALWFVAVLTLVGCASSPESSTLSLLQQAGFRPMAASTFEKQQKLKMLKPDRLVTLKAASGAVYYVYPLHTRNLLYVGREAQYAAYQNLRAAQNAGSATTQTGRRKADGGWSQAADASDGSYESWEDVWSAPSDF